MQRNAQTTSSTPRLQTAVRQVRGLTPIAAIERGFFDYAAERLQPYGFAFSDRVNLLDSAEKLGISRFRANMLLALHAHRPGAPQAVQSAAAPSTVAPSFLLVLTLEIFVVGLIAWVCM